MSSPQIEREEEADDTQEKVDIVPETPQKQVESNVEKDEVIVEKPEYSTKAVKKLSKDEREMLMGKFSRHEEDPYFKVIRMADGGIRITKRKIPLNTDIINYLLSSCLCFGESLKNPQNAKVIKSGNSQIK